MADEGATGFYKGFAVLQRNSRVYGEVVCSSLLQGFCMVL